MRRKRKSSSQAELRSSARFLYELGQLKLVQRSGWWLCGVRQAESVAEHTFRTAAIAFVLAELEGANRENACTLALFHDLAEARVNDAHRLQRKYSRGWPGAEARATADQLRGLPQLIRKALRSVIHEGSARESLESQVAKDADRLECLLQAREYSEQGHPTREWVKSSLRDLKTRSAKRLARAALQVKPSSWRPREPESSRARARVGRKHPG